MNSDAQKSTVAPKTILLPLLLLAGVVTLLYAPFLLELARLARKSELHSHIPVVAVISGYLIFTGRSTIFRKMNYDLRAGGVLAGAGLLTYAAGLVLLRPSLGPDDLLSLVMFSLAVTFAGGFWALFGEHAFKAALFPLFLLVFTVPLPAFLLDRIIPFLQHGSASLTEQLFGLLHIPVFRDGTVFALPGIAIEVAEECSGIRSSIALFITMMTGAYMFLGTWWGRTMFTAAAVPLAVVKNAVRIVTLSVLAIRVDRSFIVGGKLHRRGGIVFFALVLFLAGAILYLLRRAEAHHKTEDITADEPEGVDESNR